MSIEAVKKRIGRGLGLLRDRLARRGVRVRAGDLVASLAVLQAGGARAAARRGSPPQSRAPSPDQPAPHVAHLASGASSSMSIATILAGTAHVLTLTTPVAALAAIACGFAAERTLRAEAADGAPAPALALDHKLAPGTCFYYASLLRWTFDMDDGAANNFLKDLR